jgi:hypothetical protein
MRTFEAPDERAEVDEEGVDYSKTRVGLHLHHHAFKLHFVRMYLILPSKMRQQLPFHASIELDMTGP